MLEIKLLKIGNSNRFNIDELDTLDIRPVYCKELIKDKLDEIKHIVNYEI